MGLLSDADLKDLINPLSGLINEGIREGFWPFNPGRIFLYNDFDINYNRHRVLAEFPDTRGSDSIMLYARVWIDRYQALDLDSIALYSWIGDTFMRTIRFDLERFPIPDNIILGDS